jgi:hypothetical protein
MQWIERVFYGVEQRVSRGARRRKGQMHELIKLVRQSIHTNDAPASVL